MRGSFSFSSSFKFPPTSIAQPQISVAEQARQLAARGDSLSAQNDLAGAKQAYHTAMTLCPDDGVLCLKLAVAEWRTGAMDEAGQRLRHATELAPDLALAHSLLGEWYLDQAMTAEAVAATARAMQLAPADHRIVQSRAWVMEAVGDLEETWRLTLELFNNGVRTSSLGRLMARQARFRGQQRPALELIEQVLATGGLPTAEISNLHFSAADLLDSLGRYDEAFAYVARGNALRKPPFDIAEHHQTFDRLIDYFTRQQIRALPKATWGGNVPVFIVGMPRSGTSLVEQILASHPDVFGGGETDSLYRIVLGLLDMLSASPGDYPGCLDAFSVQQANGLAQTYLGPMRALAPGARRITDKMPLNFVHLGMIDLLFPEARVIHCRRDALDTCLSCHMTPFNNGNDFKYDLTNLGLFYREYERLMDHWKQVLDVRLFEVDYETLIDQPEHTSRQLIQFLDLPWDDRCLSFHKTARATATSSVQQVRQPIYKTSAGRWKKYEKHLGPLRDALRR